MNTAGSGLQTMGASDSSSDSVAPPDSDALTQDQINTSVAELTRLLRKYGAEKMTVPQSLDELVTNGYISALPPAPPGKKFSFDPQTFQVSLSDQ